MGKTTICIGENKDADQLRGNREADQRLCFRYPDSTILLLSKSEISNFLCLYRPVCVEPVRKPHCWFSHEAAQMVKNLFTDIHIFWLRCAKYCYHIQVHLVISAAKAASVTVFNAVHSV